MNIAQTAPAPQLPRSVYAKRRRNLLLSVVALIAGISFLASQGQQQSTEIVSVTVAQGESLWSLAEEFAPENQDPREWIYEVSNLNNLESSELTPGMQLNVPVAVSGK